MNDLVIIFRILYIGGMNMMDKATEVAHNFLVSNGFREVRGEFGIYENGLCVVTVRFDGYKIMSDRWPDVKEYGVICSRDLSIYWLVGALTWYGLIGRDYVGGV